MFDTPEKRYALSKWIIGTVTCCILIYLGMRHISSIAEVISQLLGLVKPLLVGGLLALILNVPMSYWEKFLKRRTKLQKKTRPLAIFLALISVFGILVGIAFLVVPELSGALKMIIEILGQGFDQLAQLETNTTLREGPLGTILERINIDWLGLKEQMETWFKTQSGAVVDRIIAATKSILSSTATSLVGFAFAVYILSGKEKLKRQACRLLRVWLPQKVSEAIIHVSAVCGGVFHQFVGGQTLEAVLLGTLCIIGMVILRIPYAPMVGALVGATALVPIVGAFVGTVVGAVIIMTEDPFKALVFVIFLLILQQLEGNLIYPKVVGAKLHLPSIWVLAAVTIGGNVAGPLGMLLGVPIASAAYVLIREATDQREHRLKAAA